MRTLIGRLAALALTAAMAGCGNSDPLRVTAVQLGRSLNADKTIATHTTTFTPDDKVYVSITTAGLGTGTLSVRWKVGERVVGEPKKEVSSREDAVTEFQLLSAGGFPPGDYSVDVFLDGTLVQTRTFRVVQAR